MFIRQAKSGKKFLVISKKELRKIAFALDRNDIDLDKVEIIPVSRVKPLIYGTAPEEKLIFSMGYNSERSGYEEFTALRGQQGGVVKYKHTPGGGRNYTIPPEDMLLFNLDEAKEDANQLMSASPEDIVKFVDNRRRIDRNRIAEGKNPLFPDDFEQRDPKEQYELVKEIMLRKYKHIKPIRVDFVKIKGIIYVVETAQNEKNRTLIQLKREAMREQQNITPDQDNTPVDDENITTVGN